MAKKVALAALLLLSFSTHFLLGALLLHGIRKKLLKMQSHLENFEASMAETRAQCALGHLQDSWLMQCILLQEFSKFLRVLGCYPIDHSSLETGILTVFQPSGSRRE
ncbi:hypothetical protein RJ641_018034, partial [Dillenia turbinata]